MQKFDYRSPRFPVDLPVEFTVQEATLIARCIEISKEGIRLELQEPLPPNAFGTVSISYQGRTLHLNMRIAHVGETHSGMEFIYKSDSERNAVAHLITALSDSAGRRRPVLLN